MNMARGQELYSLYTLAACRDLSASQMACKYPIYPQVDLHGMHREEAIAKLRLHQTHVGALATDYPQGLKLKVVTGARSRLRGSLR